MAPIRRGSKSGRLGGNRPAAVRRSAPPRPKSASRATRPVRTTVRRAPQPKPAPKPSPARQSSRGAARAVVARLPKPVRAPVRRVAKAALTPRLKQAGRVRSRPAAQPVRVPAASQRLRQLSVPARRKRGALSIVATGLAARAVTRVTFGPAYRARASGFMNTIVLPDRGTTGAYSYDEEVGELLDTIGRLQQAALLPAVGEDLDGINVLVSRLPASLEALRARGYVHQRRLEGQVTGFAIRWDQIYDNLAEALSARQADLVEAANRLLDLVDRLYEPNADRGTVEACWSAVRALQSQVEAAYRGLRGQYDDLAGELESVEAELARLAWTMDQVERAPLTLLAAEAPLRAADARWLHGPDEEGRPGLLILTDQRILFVHQQEMVTQRFLIFTLKRELIEELEFEVPVRAVTAAEVIQQSGGVLGLKSGDALDVRFDETAPLPATRWLLSRDDAQIWSALIGRARLGDVDADRTEEATRASEALDAARRQAPTHCPNCSAPLDLPAGRGAGTITCRYCGTTVKLY